MTPRQRLFALRAGLTSQAIIVKISHRSTTEACRSLDGQPVCRFNIRRRSAVALSLLAFRVALGYTPLASSYRILSARCRRRASSREKIQSCTSHRRDTFFCSVAGNGSATVDEIFEAVDGLSSGRTCARRDKRPSAVAGENLETSGRRACVPQAQASLKLAARDRRHRSRAVCASFGLSHGAQSADGSTEFQVNSSNRFSAQAEVALAGDRHTQPAPREARFPVQIAEGFFGLSTRPAVGLPRTQFISSLMRARCPNSSVASDLRGT
jgi:hypothetical protein